MSLKNLGNIYIAYEKFDNPARIEKKIDHSDWVKYIESHQETYMWFEETELGKQVHSMTNAPDNKIRAVTRASDKKKSYSFVVTLSKNGYLNTTIPRITIAKLEMLFEMAEALHAYVLSSGRRILDRAWLEQKIAESGKKK